MTMLSAIILAILLSADVAYGGLMFRYGPNAGDTEFMYNCDDCYQSVDLSYRYQFFWWGYNRIFISSNGYVTFGTGYSWYAPWYSYAFYGPKMIAPYWSDIYLPYDPSGSNIWYRETNEEKYLRKAQKIIRKSFDSCGSYFTPTALFIVTWSDVVSYCEAWCPWYYWNYWYCYKYYRDYSTKMYSEISAKAFSNETTPSSSIGQESDKPQPSLNSSSKSYSEEEEETRSWWWPGRNTFQLVLATDGYNTFAIMNYKRLDWNYCFSYNKLLFNGGYGYHFYLNTVNPATDLVSTSNVHKAGRWAYKISGGRIQTSHCVNVGR